MPLRLRIALALALLFGAALPVACDPQVVDAVQGMTTGGNGGSGGSGVSGGAGSAGSAGAAGSAGGASDLCPDGGSPNDGDGDGVPDCTDLCPGDPFKIRPAFCGCGFLDENPDGPTCNDLAPLLAHRYTFDGTGVNVIDSKGSADGIVVNAELAGNGTLVLAGGTSDQYVNLPNRILSVFEAGVTIEAWLQWNGGLQWQRIFDFGHDTTGVEGAQSGGASYLFLTPRTADQDTGDPNYQGPYLRAVYGKPVNMGGVNESRANAELNMPRIFPSGRIAHVALVVEGDTFGMSVYIDGVRAGEYVADGTSANPAVDLTLVNDINCWIGRSQFQLDAELDATMHEFRIYGASLTPEQVDLSFKLGPDPGFLP